MFKSSVVIQFDGKRQLENRIFGRWSFWRCYRRVFTAKDADCPQMRALDVGGDAETCIEPVASSEGPFPIPGGKEREGITSSGYAAIACEETLRAMTEPGWFTQATFQIQHPGCLVRAVLFAVYDKDLGADFFGVAHSPFADRPDGLFEVFSVLCERVDDGGWHRLLDVARDDTALFELAQLLDEYFFCDARDGAAQFAKAMRALAQVP